jgi:hypothetical protein
MFEIFFKRINPAILIITGFIFLPAESGGFEPADPVTGQQFSRLPQSTTLPTLRRKSTNSNQLCKLSAYFFQTVVLTIRNRMRKLTADLIFLGRFIFKAVKR